MHSAKTKQLIFITLISFCLIALAGAVVYFIDQSTINQFIASIHPNNFYQVALLTFGLAVLMAIGLPRQVVAFSLGYLLGTLVGATTATIAACCGCILTYVSARHFFHQRIEQRFPTQQQLLSSFFAQNTLQKALIIRLLPIGSNFITNLIAGSVRAPFWPYHLGTCLGFIPQMTLFAMLGAGIKVGQTEQISLSIGLILVAGMLSFRLYRQSKHRLPALSAK